VSHRDIQQQPFPKVSPPVARSPVLDNFDRDLFLCFFDASNEYSDDLERSTKEKEKKTELTVPLFKLGGVCQLI
jgi:hypothetical protein